MTPTKVIAVFDIGKTNKKFLLFDEEYHIVYETSTQLPETVDEDGDPCEDINALTNWILTTFIEANSSPEFDIVWINYSTYGASFVHLGNDGRPVAPLYNYLKPFPEELKTLFYYKYGGENAFAKATASPVLGSLNSGMMLYLLKQRKPQIYARIKWSLHLPQYVSALFTTEYYSDLTSIGCHTNLWEFRTHKYHPWVDKEDVGLKLAPIVDSSFTIEISSVHKIMYSGIGIHDSSAALVPYLTYAKERFVLLSTGTWCIALNPFNDEPLTSTELRHDCLSYLNFRGKPVKASRLFSGHVHEEQCRALAKHFNVPDDAYKKVEILKAKPWSENLSDFNSFEEAYNALISHLVDQQVESTNLVLQPDIDTIFVDGGFSQNKIFMQLLSAAYPDKKVYTTSIVQASALGAAMVVHGADNNLKVKRDILNLVRF